MYKVRSRELIYSIIKSKINYYHLIITFIVIYIFTILYYYLYFKSHPFFMNIESFSKLILILNKF